MRSTIAPSDLSRVCEALGLPLEPRELKEAYAVLDARGTGRIYVQELAAYWLSAPIEPVSAAAATGMGGMTAAMTAAAAGGAGGGE